MTRNCPECGKALAPSAVQCSACGHSVSEAQDRRSDPDDPRCGACGVALPLMSLDCPSCGATGYPALRSRRGKKSLGTPPDSLTSEQAPPA